MCQSFPNARASASRGEGGSHQKADLDSVDPGQGLRICPSNELPGGLMLLTGGPHGGEQAAT